MNTVLWKKALGDSRLLLICLVILLFAFCWLHVWITSQLPMGNFAGILQNIPQDWERLSPIPFDQLLTYAGRIVVIYEEPVTYLVMAIWTIGRSSDSVSGPIGRGTMESVLAQPISRGQLLATHSLITLLGVLVLSTTAFAGSYVGVYTSSVEQQSKRSWTLPLLGMNFSVTQDSSVEEERVPMRDQVDPKFFVPAAINYSCFGCFLAGMTTFLSSWDRYRWRTIGLAVGFYIVQIVLEVISLAADSFHWLRYATFLTVYEPIKIVNAVMSDWSFAWACSRYDESGEWVGLGPLGCDCVLLGLAFLGFLAAAIVFRRRDIPAPL